MAVHCDACGTRLMSAIDNEGGFQTDDTFVGFNPHSPNRIRDTCETCAKRMRTAVTKVAKAIAARARKRLEKKNDKDDRCT